MRILMASDLFHPFLLGGGGRRMYEIARRLAKKHEIHVLTRRFKGLPSYEVHEGIHIHRVFVPSTGIKRSKIGFERGLRSSELVRAGYGND